MVSLLALGLLGPGWIGCSREERASTSRLEDLEGRAVDPFAGEAAATVLLFTRTDCPISNRYAPTVRRLSAELEPRNVRFWLVYSDPEESPDLIQRHCADFGYRIPVIRDLDQDLQRLVGATVTPEAGVFDASRGLIYRGRIDDRFVDFGKTRPAATRHDLQDAIDHVLRGGRDALVFTKAVGCPIPEVEAP